MELALIIAHLVISLILIIVVLLQEGKQAGLSGAVAGAAETFFGKNKGRTVDAMLKKLTAVIAVLFIATSVSLAIVAARPEEAPAETAQITEENVEDTEEPAETETNEEDAEAPEAE